MTPRAILLMVLLLLVPSMMWAESEAWVELKDGTLTFHYDENRSASTATTFDLPTTGAPQWLGKDIAHVVIDESFQAVRPTSCAQWFYNLKNLTDITGLKNLNTSDVTSMENMFALSSSLTTLDLRGLNTERVTSMKGMFNGCTSLTVIKLSTLNTSQVTNMANMFCSCTSLTMVNLSAFDTQNVTDMSQMFAMDTELTTIYASESFVTKQVTSSDNMFYGCTKLPHYDTKYVDKTNAMINGYMKALKAQPWAEYVAEDKLLAFRYNEDFIDADNRYDLPAAGEEPGWLNEDICYASIDAAFADARPTSCSKWFYNLENLKGIYFLNYLNTSKVTDMSGMFYGCKNITSLDLSQLNTENVTTMKSMFAGCSSLTELDLTSFNTAKVTDMSYMFWSCKQLTTLYLTSFSTSKVKSMEKMFVLDANLSKIYVSSSFVTSQVSSAEDLFSGCNSLPGYDEQATTKAKACFYPAGYFLHNNIMWAAYDATTETLTFHYDDNKASDKTSTYTYYFPTEYSQSQWSKDAHDGIITVKKVVVDNSFQEARPTGCTSWFAMMKDLTEIEGLENINTSKVASFYGTFYGSSELTSLDLTSWDMSSAKVTESMFGCCYALKSIYVSESFALPADCSDTEAMFQGCVNLPGFVEDNDDGTYAHYKEGGYLTLRRHASVGDTLYNIDGYAQPTCYDDVTFTDGAAYQAPASFTFSSESKASYTRTVKNHWATLCLPFAFSAEEGTASFYAVDTYADGNIAVKKLTGTITAGTPVLAYVTDGELNVSATGAAAVATPATDPVLQGTFTQTAVEDADYIIANDHFWNALYLKEHNNAAQNVYVAPYRAYLTLGLSEGAKPNSISINNDVTDGINGIASAESLEDLFDGAELYDLQGRRLAAPQRGMMIVRKGGVSRKVVVR